MSDLVSALQSAIETTLSDVNTTMPGTLISYDSSRNRAVVRPSLPKALADGRDLEPPLIHECPVAWPMGGGFLMTWPLRPGDGVELRFAQRSMEGWSDGRDTAPDDPRRFDLSDCVVDPCLKATGVKADPDAVQMSYAGTTMRFEPDGTSRIKSTKTIIENPVDIQGPLRVFDTAYVQGNLGCDARIDAATDMVSGNVSLRTHRHTASGGSGIGGPPSV